jgi:hypothetical protein
MGVIVILDQEVFYKMLKFCKMLKTENGFQIAQKSGNLPKIIKVRSKIYEKIILTVLDILATLCIDV